MSLTKRILICPDTFKGTLSSLGVTQTIRDALLSSSSSSSSSPQPFEIDVAPMSDGGAGLLDSLLNGCKGLQSVPIESIVGPLGTDHIIASRFAVHPEQRYAVVEMAEASGLPLVDQRLKALNAANGTNIEKDPRVATSYGTGQIMAHIAAKYSAEEVERIYIGIGGSSTNECGLGALQALGMDIYVRPTNSDDANKTEVRLETPFMGKDLANVVRLDTNTPSFKAFTDRFPGDSIVLLCDVSNPLVGPHGATYIYGPQKGARGKTPVAILDELEAGMLNVAAVINQHVKMQEANGSNSDSNKKKSNASASVADIGVMKGAGGAGGMSGGFFALLNANWQAGAEVLQNVFLRLDERIAAADVIITGEGRFDEQTIQYGKTVASIYKTMLEGIDKADTAAAAAINGGVGGNSRSSSVTDQKKKLFVVVCGLYQGPAMADESLVPSLCVANKVDLHAFALSPNRFPSEKAMTETALCLQQMTEKDIKPFLLAQHSKL